MNIRKFRKWLAWALFVFAIALAIPSGFDEWINFTLASFLVSWLKWDMFNSLFFTYTFLPLICFFLAIFIYPANNGYVINKFKNILTQKTRFIRNKFKKNPFVSIVISIIFFIVLYNLFKIYYGWIQKFIT